MPTPSLPGPLRAHLCGYATDGFNHRTESRAQVHLYRSAGQPDLFLKIRSLSAAPEDASLERERQVLDWIGERLPVPRVRCYHREGDDEYLLCTRVPGSSSYLEEHRRDLPHLVRLLGEGLARIHDLPADGCPVDWGASALVARAEYLLREGLIDAGERVGARWEHDPDALLEAARRLRPGREDRVFTHGDYCLPNVLVKGGRLCGFVDWGAAGIGDRYRDLAAAAMSVDRNLGGEWVMPFFAAYGLQAPDPDKLRYYRLLYDLT